ncbi:VOC family protein [Microtetraspora malaysiensis]|uniref:VOC family protein n=1 Tax=Microtetraspora malaysiensis TaxID=161358 RepID=A0ABW6SLP5_9ACTN
MLHHVELWVPDLRRALVSWQWLLEVMGYTLFQEWPEGRSWRLGSAYIVLEQSPALTDRRHDRCRPGLNHLAFHVESQVLLDALVEQAPAHGWTLLFPETSPLRRRRSALRRVLGGCGRVRGGARRRRFLRSRCHPVETDAKRIGASGCGAWFCVPGLVQHFLERRRFRHGYGADPVYRHPRRP